MQTKPATITRTVLSTVFGCMAAADVILSAIIYARAFLRTPFRLAESIYDSSATEWEGLFNLIETFAVGTAEVIGMLLTLMFLYFCSWISLGLGTAATVLSFNPYKSKLKILGRVTGIIGIIYGLFAVIVTVCAYIPALNGG
ncbi:MAG: hypothetical protein J6128_03120 [Clostridia bacterium]|nr:hypothetical protein [Clostridia bacterium]